MYDKIITYAFYSFWLFLPAGLANMAPPIANKIPGLNKWKTPMDFGKKWHGKRLLGSNKTWRGLVCGTLLASITCASQYLWLSESRGYATVASIIISLIIGASLGFGALMGDAVESFFKRQANVPSGHSWFPFDQTDYIIGGLAFSYPLLHWPPRMMIVIFVVYFGLHLLVSYVGYLLGFKDKPI